MQRPTPPLHNCCAVRPTFSMCKFLTSTTEYTRELCKEQRFPLDYFKCMPCLSRGGTLPTSQNSILQCPVLSKHLFPCLDIVFPVEWPKQSIEIWPFLLRSAQRDPIFRCPPLRWLSRASWDFICDEVHFPAVVPRKRSCLGQLLPSWSQHSATNSHCTFKGRKHPGEKFRIRFWPSTF